MGFFAIPSASLTSGQIKHLYIEIYEWTPKSAYNSLFVVSSTVNP